MPLQAIHLPFPAFRQSLSGAEVESGEPTSLTAVTSESGPSSSESSMAVAQGNPTLPSATQPKGEATAATPPRRATPTRRKSPFGGSGTHSRLANTINGLDLCPVPPSPPPAGPLPPTPVGSDRGHRPSISGQFNHSASETETDTYSTDSSTVLDTPNSSFQSGDRAAKSKSRWDQNRVSTDGPPTKLKLEHTGSTATMQKGQGQDSNTQQPRVAFSTSRFASMKLLGDKGDDKRNSMRDDDSLTDPGQLSKR